VFVLVQIYAIPTKDSFELHPVKTCEEFCFSVSILTVDLLEFKRSGFLVAPRGRTQWVRNAEAAGEVALETGFQRRTFRIRIVSNDENRRS
jgi:hypothetical protein